MCVCVGVVYVCVSVCVYTCVYALLKKLSQFDEQKFS